MAFTVVQAQRGAAASATSATTTAMTTTTGSMFVVFTNRLRTKTEATTPITDSKGNTYTRVGEWNNGVADSGVGQAMAIWISGASPTAGASHTFTYTLTVSDFPAIIAYEVTGLSITVDKGGSTLFALAGTTGTTITSPTTPTTGTAADVIFGVAGSAGDATQAMTISASVGGGTYTTPTNGEQETVLGYPITTGYQAVSATGTFAVLCTWGGAGETSRGIGIAAIVQAVTAVQQQLTMLGVGA